MNPWEIKTDDRRNVNNLTNVLIFSEDSVSERYYAEWFQNKDLKVTVIPDQKSAINNIKNIIKHCEKNHIIVKQDISKYNVKDGHLIWGIFDRDSTRDGDNSDLDIEFNMAIEYATSKGFNIAWSNDCFELWILLHFRTEEEVLHLIHRDLIYEELSRIFIEFVDEPVKLENFNYKYYFKKRTRFIEVVRTRILPKTKLAIERSKNLLKKFEDKKYLSEFNPSTNMHELVENLLSLGKKEVPL